MKKGDGFSYFGAYARQAGYAYELTCNLKSSMESGDFGSRELLDSLHTIENDADEVNHQIQAQLLTDFVVPFERGSVAALANAIDNICDAVEDVAIQAFYYHCRGIEPEGIEMISQVVQATGMLKEAVDLLDARLARAGDIKRLLVGVQDTESECDRIYIEAIWGLYARNGMDAEQRRIAHSILSAIEKSSDEVEGAAECLEMIIVENA